VATWGVELEHPACGWPEIIEVAVAIRCVEPDANAVFGATAGGPFGEILLEEFEGLSGEAAVAEKVVSEAGVLGQVWAQAEGNVVGRGSLLGAAGTASLAGENAQVGR
jgi:hypothetical protein